MKRKHIIIITVIASCAISAIINFLAPKTFESTSIVRIGVVSEPLLSKPEAYEILKSHKLIATALATPTLNGKTGAFDRKTMLVLEDIKDTDLVKIRVFYHAPDLAAEICNAISGEFVTLGQALYRQNSELLLEQTKEFEARLKVTREEIDSFRKKIETETGNTYLLQSNIAGYEMFSFSLAEKIFQLRQDLLQSANFEVFEPAVVPQFSVKPNKKANLMMAAGLGLIAGILIIYFVEYTSNPA